MWDIGNTQRVDPVGLLVLGIAAALILHPKRIYAFAGLMLVIAFLPSTQRIVVATLDFPFIRIAVLLGILRCAMYQEARLKKWTVPDVLVIIWMLWSSVTQFLIYGSTSAMITRFGYGIEAAGMYFLARFLVTSRKDVFDLLKVVAIFAMMSAPFFFLESQTGRNVFSALGGVPEYSLVRSGRLRCQGPFSHPIMAGVFWAMWIPPMFVLGFLGRSLAPLWILGLGAIIVVVFATASSTPAMALILGLGCLATYSLRRGLSVAVWSGIGIAAVLHLVMAKGVHHVLARINIVSGSTGWHRYHLMDGAINHVGEWFLIGTKSTAHWGWGLDDVTNQFVLEGVRGGFLGMVLFTALLLYVMKANALVAIRSRDRQASLMNWAIFSSLVAMAFGFIGVSIFGAAVSGYFLFQGAAMSIAEATEDPAPATRPAMRRNPARGPSSMRATRQTT